MKSSIQIQTCFVKTTATTRAYAGGKDENIRNYSMYYFYLYVRLYHLFMAKVYGLCHHV